MWRTGIDWLHRLIYIPASILLLNFFTGNAVAQTYPDTAKILQALRLYRATEKSNPDSVLFHCNILLQQSKQAHYTPGIVSSLGFIAAAYYKSGNNDKAIESYKKAIVYAYSLPRTQVTLSGWYNDIATVFNVKGDYDSAIKYFYAAIAVAEKYPSSFKTESIYGNLATTLTNLNRFDEAIYYLDKQQSIAIRNNDSESLYYTYVNKADVYEKQKNWDLCFLYSKKALEYCKKTPYAPLENIGCYYSYKNMPEKALPYLLKAYAIRKDVSLWDINKGNYELAKVYYDLGYYAKAKTLLLQTLEDAEIKKINPSIIKAAETLSKVYAATGRYKDAYDYRLKSDLVKDSTQNVEKTKDINQLEIQYQSAEKNREIAQKQLLISNQQNTLKRKNLWIGGISAGALLLVLIFVIAYRMYRHKQHIQAKQIQIMKHEQEISILKAMVQGEEKERTRIAQELHDGIVSQLLAVKLHFSSILEGKDGDYLLSSDFSEILQHLEDTTRDLRKTAHNLMPETVLQGGIVVALHSFCQKMARSADISIPFQTYGLLPRLDTDIELSVYRIVQELVQNAVKHAHANQILVQLNYQEGLLSITVEDNGMGFLRDMEDSKGTGLRNIHTRLKALSGKIDWQSEVGEGTAVYLEFNVYPVKELSPYAYQANHHR